MSKVIFYKVGKYEFLLNNVDAVTEIYTGDGAYKFDVIVDGAEINIPAEPGVTTLEQLKEARESLIGAWKKTV